MGETETETEKGRQSTVLEHRPSVTMCCTTNSMTGDHKECCSEKMREWEEEIVCLSLALSLSLSLWTDTNWNF